MDKGEDNDGEEDEFKVEDEHQYGVVMGMIFGNEDEMRM